MWKWIRKREVEAREEPAAATSITNQSTRRAAGKYLALYEYLEKRYADFTVLTFEQIEDLLGFALPSLARTNRSWWAIAAANVDAQPHAAAWILAGRVAIPNLQAKTVAFERLPKAKRSGPR